MSQARRASERGVEFLIREMNEHDLLEVVELEEASGLSRWGWDAYRQELDKPESVMLVACERALAPVGGRRVAGFIAARACADELHVNNIGVLADLRRRGMGERLLGAALERAARAGATRAILEVRAGNEAAQALYRRFGFEVSGRRRNYYKGPAEDALVMTLTL